VSLLSAKATSLRQVYIDMQGGVFIYARNRIIHRSIDID